MGKVQSVQGKRRRSKVDRDAKERKREEWCRFKPYFDRLSR